MYQEILQKAFNAKKKLQSISPSVIDEILTDYSDILVKNTHKIITENLKDLENMDIQSPKYDRLLLDKSKILNLAKSVLNMARCYFESNATLERRFTDCGLDIEKVRTPLGVVGIIFESRPNVAVDAIIICLKTQNVCLLKGSSEAEFSNKILIDLAKSILEKYEINQDSITLLPSSRDASMALIQAKGLVDVCIPRGSKSLIDFVRENAKIPVIETGAGVVHIFIDKFANIEMAKNIILNAKTRRPSVCNSVDCIIIHREILNKLPEIIAPLLEQNVEIFVDEEAFNVLSEVKNKNIQKAENECFGTEFLSLKMAIKTVQNIHEALCHIEKFSSKHSEAIVTENKENAKIFLESVDSACIFHNTSTSFSDGECFGMMGEIGISTQKLHARGPFSINELTTYKWIIKSNGFIR